tara:strand:+ start:5252 stop:6475 length:1224 start_codon:yes stop_codon:yes gene_type:complete
MRYFRYTLDDLKRSSDRKLFTYITFFAGGGGSSCGYKLAGGDCLFMNEFQQVAVNDYLNNFPNTTHLCKDINSVSPEQIMEMTGLQPRELDILDGSPPCPPFSMSGTKQKGWGKEKMAYGKKQKEIERLTFKQIEIAKVLQPKVLIIENVKGFTMKYATDLFEEVLESVRQAGYGVTYKVLKGSNFGVPQKRERVFIVGVRNDILKNHNNPFITFSPEVLSGFVFPEPEKKYATLQDAIGDLKDDKENIEESEVLCESMKKSAKYKWLRRLEKNPDRVVSVGDDVVKPFYQKWIAHRERLSKNIGERKVEEKFSFFQSRRVPWNQSSHTLSEQGLQTSLAVHLHPSEDRGYTVKESKRIMTLPEDYQFTGKLNENLARIGLMVAPLQMKYLSENIYNNILKPYKEQQ